MKKLIFLFSLIAGAFMLASCGPKKQQATVEEIPEFVSVDNVVKDSIIDSNGNVLHLTFYNVKGVVQAILGADTIVMTQDTTASGIRFSNARYVYEEWQGKVTLSKDGNIIFQHEK